MTIIPKQRGRHAADLGVRVWKWLRNTAQTSFFLTLVQSIWSKKEFFKSMGVKKFNYLGWFTPGLKRSDLFNIYIKIHVSQSVCLFVCPFFSPPSRCPISNLSTDLESLGHRGANKNIYKTIEAEIKTFKNIFPKN